MTKVVIVDDEPFGREQVRFLLKSKFPDIQVVAEAETYEEAVDAINRFQPQLVFLDIELGPKTGFEVLEKTEFKGSEIIFVTAFDHYAIKAIKFSALDYILKPVKPTEFTLAVTKFLSKARVFEDQQRLLLNLKANLAAESPDFFRLAVHSSGRTHFLSPADITRCEADGNYTRIYTRDKNTLLSSKTLKDYEDLLKDYHFLRIHRAHLVNRNFIKGMTGNHELVLKDNSTVEVSRRKSGEIRNLLFE